MLGVLSLRYPIIRAPDSTRRRERRNGTSMHEEGREDELSKEMDDG